MRLLVPIVLLAVACGGKKPPEAPTPEPEAPTVIPMMVKANPDKLVAQAIELIEDGSTSKLEEAEKKLKEALSVDGSHLEARLNLGVAQYHLDKLTDARAAFDAVIAADASIADAYRYAGAVDEKGKNYGGAVSRYRSGIAVAPEDMPLRVALIGALRAQGRPLEAIDEAKAALAINANSVEVYNNFGLAYMDQGNLTLARFIFQTALRAIPEAKDNAYIHCNLGWVRFLEGNRPLATMELEKAVELDDELVPALVYLSRIYMDDKNYVDTVPLLETATRLDPENADLYLTLGVAYRGVGQLDDAKAAYEKALSLDPSNPAPHFNLGVLLGDFKKDYDGAVSAFNTYIQSGGERADLATEYIGEVEKEKKRAARREKALEAKKKRDEEKKKQEKLLEEAKKREEAEADAVPEAPEEAPEPAPAPEEAPAPAPAPEEAPAPDVSPAPEEAPAPEPEGGE